MHHQFTPMTLQKEKVKKRGQLEKEPDVTCHNVKRNNKLINMSMKGVLRTKPERCTYDNVTEVTLGTVHFLWHVNGFVCKSCQSRIPQ